MAESISLTVRSQNSQVVTTASQPFIVSRMTDIRANQNTATTHSVTEAGDASNQLSAWKIYGTGEKLNWELTNPSGTIYQVDLYRGTHGIKVATGYVSGNGTIYGHSVNESGIAFQVTVAFSAADTGAANTVQCTTFADEKDLELPGNTQFDYDMGNGYIVKFTVNETVSAINSAISGDSMWLTASASLTTAEITTLSSVPVEIIAAPGASYVIQVQSAVISYDHGTADITGNLTADLVTSTTGTILYNATNAFSGAADKITRFVDVAGVVDANEGISIKMHTGDPTMTTSTGTARVSITYCVTAI